MTVEAAMAAMRTAEQEADFNARFDDTRNSRWARDRLRLIARDRATLKRHTPDRCAFCNARAIHGSPSRCPDLRAVIDYWTGVTETP